MRLQIGQLERACWLVLLVTVGVLSAQGATLDQWESTPYRIHLTLAIDAPGQLAGQLAKELPEYLKDRVTASVGAVWLFEVDLASGPLRHRLLQEVESQSVSDLDSPDSSDKQLFVAVKATPWGYHLAAREFDTFTRRWGATLELATPQLAALPETLFALVRKTVAPLAIVEVDRRDPNVAKMTFRAAALPRKSDDFIWVEPGDVFLPLLRRVDRDDQLAENGIQDIPWTYLEVFERGPSAAESAEGDPQFEARIHSGISSPLTRRRRARTEQVAIALRPDDARELTVRLTSRTHPEKPLIGYEVQSRVSNEDTLYGVGFTDEAGEIQIPARSSNVQLLFVKSAGTVLARIPIVPGMGGEIEVALPDDEVRLQAAARLASLREDLVDLVARRNIYAARVRQQIEEKNFDRARDLLAALDQLPSQIQFNRILDREALLHRSDDPLVQRRIDELFAATKVVLGQYLDPRQIGKLHDELRAAQSKGT